MLNTIMFLLMVVLPKILLSIIFGVTLLFLSMDIFSYAWPEKTIDLVYAFIDLMVLVSTFGACSSLEELNAKAKKEGFDEIDPFDLF